MSTITIDKDLLLQKLSEYLDVPTLTEKLKACEGKKIADMPQALLDVITEVVVTVETIMTDIGEAGHGGEKEDAVVAFLDEIIKLPWYLEPYDDNVIRPIVRSIVATLNKGLDYEWPKKAVTTDDCDASFAKIELESFKKYNRDWRDGMSASHIIAKVISHAAKLITEGDFDKGDGISHWYKILWYNMAWNELMSTDKLLDDRPTDGGNGNGVKQTRLG